MERIYRYATLVTRSAKALLFGSLLAILTAPATANPTDEIRKLLPLWKDNAPRCQGHPSSDNCHDGDMTLFSGLLCAAGEPLGCSAVKAAQDSSGRWHRSPRLAADPSLKPANSFSWDMALGVQLYVARTNDTAALQRWLTWIESSRPCVVGSPAINGKTYCLVRGWPRWCTDDTEKGCTAKPQNLATLIRTIDTLGIAMPAPAEDQPPSGLAGEVLKKLQTEAREANAALSLKALLERSRGLQPNVLLADAAVNREGYPRHLVGVEIMLARELGIATEEVSIAATTLALKEKQNPFFQYLWEGQSERVRRIFLGLAPKTLLELPQHKDDWAWQRAEEEQKWKEANLWDFYFLGRLLSGPP